MKLSFIILALSVACFSSAQTRRADFSAIDWKASSVDAPTVDSLAWKLTSIYPTELEKVRSIFSWITQHIAYNTGIFNRRTAGHRPEPIDTVSVWRSANEMTAEKVLRRRIAVCDGYAKLFKTLCDYAGIRCEIITGYAKCSMERGGKFRTNHSWNAVMIDSSWRLLDVTWASGYVSYANEFVQHTDESYFLTPPDQFILDHYPENLSWTLLNHPPALKEYQYTPYRYKSFVKYGINSYRPSNGLIEASVGDTVQIEITVRDAEKNKLISSDPFFDSTMLTVASSVYLQPSTPGSSRVIYTYVIEPNPVEWLNVLYNEDMILRYRLRIKNKPQ
jgi:transglutaminase/protease-like cytokinesis protein 3